MMHDLYFSVHATRREEGDSSHQMHPCISSESFSALEAGEDSGLLSGSPYQQRRHRTHHRRQRDDDLPPPHDRDTTEAAAEKIHTVYIPTLGSPEYSVARNISVTVEDISETAAATEADADDYPPTSEFHTVYVPPLGSPRYPEYDLAVKNAAIYVPQLHSPEYGADIVGSCLDPVDRGQRLAAAMDDLRLRLGGGGLHSSAEDDTSDASRSGADRRIQVLDVKLSQGILMSSKSYSYCMEKK